MLVVVDYASQHRHMGAGEVGQMAAHTVFAVLDQLSIWCRECQEAGQNTKITSHISEVCLDNVCNPLDLLRRSRDKRDAR